ncbi:hypothetical protein SK177_004829 [Salmonella enterica]|uniref:Uncharacterized protein n=3 Tax=Enterobacterales TaxID=91347 RepID=A0A1B1IL00_ECOLX|nr:MULTISPECIES: hypothetical protein [Enterobacterales]EEO5085728.1 hypothetical protein [Salmonella enterica]EGO0235516.1 hypothetical protein [Salmonella enterica subsp. enterica serovar Bovismorbificans]EHJ0190082.1 hypothetical protein [Shigella flexneri]EJR0927749.1 hypothetical protein [Salmonella enterica subsp. enterica]CHY47424.1 Uncharacterised protein [Salmonella enterica subsp. enterica serovar Typhi]
MTSQHPLLKIALNGDGLLSWPNSPGQTMRCPTCMRDVITGPDGDLIHQMEEGANPCTPSVDVVISKAIIELLSTGERLYVNPVKNANRTLAPSFIFLHKDKQLRPFINTEYQPAGATWRSDKGNRLGFFYMDERASKINKDQFDFIAVIDPSTFQAEFKTLWSMCEFDNPLAALQHLLASENMSSVWVKWPVKSLQPRKEVVKADYWYDYYSPHYPAQQAACTATVIGLEGNVSGETIYMLQIAVDRSIVEYQLVKSLGVILLLDNTGNLVSETHPHFDIIIKACISGVRDFVRQNPRMRSVEHQITSAMPG